MMAWQIALVGVAAFCAGAMNSVAGGGTWSADRALGWDRKGEPI